MTRILKIFHYHFINNNLMCIFVVCLIYALTRGGHSFILRKSSQHTHSVSETQTRLHVAKMRAKLLNGRV